MRTWSTIAVTLAAGLAVVAQAGSPWPASATTRAQGILAQMSLIEKLAMVHGYSGGYVGDVPANTRLNIPALNLEDGPQGVADGVKEVTAWPSALTVGMSWDPSAMYAFGAAMGAEQVLKGTNVMLGPGVNLARVPWGGRNFEYLGEDPVLSSKLVAAEVAGIQSNNISACVKHYLDNNQEYNRDSVSENVPTRAQWELYTRPFAAAVDAGVGSAMCSYNRINNTYACENEFTLNLLKSDLGFRGWVMSDWGATHSTVQAAMAGLDQQMPDDSYFGAALAAAVASGSVPSSRIDDMVMRMLTPMAALGLLDNPPTGNLNANASSLNHDVLARTLAERSITLLKNDGSLLPLNAKSLKSIGVFGDETTVVGGGSGGVVLPYVVTPIAGIATYLNASQPVRPVNCSFVKDVDFYQPGNPCVDATSADDCCAQCTAQTSCNAFTFTPGTMCSGGSGTGGACWIKPNNAGQTPHTGFVSGTCAAVPPYVGPVNLTYNDGTDLASAVALAKSVDVAVVVVATTSHEGADRGNLSLPWWQDDLVAAVVAANPRTVVVARCPGACLMPWANAVPAILFQLMPGQEAGSALANALFGTVNPSGKLPVSFPNNMSDTWLLSPAQYPGTQRSNSWLEADYTENLLIGYRWYDAQNTNPLWPFGHGLSYTSFKYANLAVTGTVSRAANTNATVTARLTNAGAVAGAEVAQLYVGFPAAANEPPKLLKNFAKVFLPAGGSAPLSFTLSATDLQIYSDAVGGWTLVPGTYSILLGSSSRDIRLTGSLTVTN